MERLRDIARPALRLRLWNDGACDLVLVDRNQDFFGRIRSLGHRQEITTVRHRRWNQFEREPVFGAGADRYRVLDTHAADDVTIAVKVTEYAGIRETGHGTTYISQTGEIRWNWSAVTGTRDSSGEMSSGTGSGIDAQGHPYTITVSGNRTTVVKQLDGGGARIEVTTKGVNETTKSVQLVDPQGTITASGQETRNDVTGSFSRVTVTGDGMGGVITTTETGTGSTVETRDRVHTDAGGNVVDTERTASAADNQGNSSETTSTVDYSTGEVTIKTVSKDADGTVTSHETVTDASGNTVSDTQTVTAPGGGGSGLGSGSGGGGDGGSGDGGGGGGNGTGAGNGTGTGDGSGSGSGDGGAGAGSGGGDATGGPTGGGGSEDTPDDDSVGSGGRTPHFGTGHDAPASPGGLLGSIIHGPNGLGGGGDDGNLGDGAPSIIAERLKKVIADRLQEGADGEVGGSGGLEGGGEEGPLDGPPKLIIDLTLPPPPGVVDDWGDRPNPRAMAALSALAAARGMALSTLAVTLEKLSA